jgi:hypothetical protein
VEAHLASHSGRFDLCAGIVESEQAIRDVAEALLKEDSRRRTAVSR